MSGSFGGWGWANGQDLPTGEIEGEPEAMTMPKESDTKAESESLVDKIKKFFSREGKDG